MEARPVLGDRPDCLLDKPWAAGLNNERGPRCWSAENPIYLCVFHLSGLAPRQCSDSGAGKGSGSRTGDQNTERRDPFSQTKKTVVLRTRGNHIIFPLIPLLSPFSSLPSSPLSSLLLPCPCPPPPPHPVSCCFLEQQSRETKTLAFKPKDQGEVGGEGSPGNWKVSERS